MTDFDVSHLKIDNHCYNVSYFGDPERCDKCFVKNDTAYWYCKTMRDTPDNSYNLREIQNWKSWIEMKMT